MYCSVGVTSPKHTLMATLIGEVHSNFGSRNFVFRLLRIFYCAEYKYRLLEVKQWWFINNGPRETFSMLEMRSIILALVALCDDVLLSDAIFLCWL